MYAVEAIFDGSSFRPLQPIPVKENYEVIITFVKPVKRDAVRPPFEFDSMPGEMFDVRVNKQAVPELSKKRPFSDLFGEWSGKIWMADDFDAPLEDMRDYM